MRQFITIIAIVLCYQFSFAQNHFGLLIEGKHIGTLGINANPILNANADYNLKFQTNKKHLQRLGFIAHLNVPFFTQEKFDLDLKIGSNALIPFSNKFKAIAGLTWGISRTADINANYIHSGFKLDMLPGYYGKKWVFAAHLAMNYQPWINIQHSDYTKQAFQEIYPNNNGKYNSPKDGWFFQNNILIQTGFGIAYIKTKWQVNLTAGFQVQPNSLRIISFPDIGIMPFYGGLNLSLKLPSKKHKT